ncbi:hypothetical protein A3Q56_00835, partial [Intoshia linei]
MKGIFIFFLFFIIYAVSARSTIKSRLQKKQISNNALYTHANILEKQDNLLDLLEDDDKDDLNEV